ncbi:MAG: hypothetical protein Q9162_000916 [Coniocarpon cinnabarinum]
MKPLILARELRVPHLLSVIDTHDEWYYKIHPERYVPALRDRDPDDGSEIVVFESTACLQYLAAKFDHDGAWIGRTLKERAAVMSWTAYQTAGLGPTAKYWLYFLKGYPNRQNPEPQPRTIEKLRENVIRQWDILESRLAQPSQAYVAVADRPTIADLSYLPFAMPVMFGFLDVSLGKYPRIEKWSSSMLERPAIREIMAEAPKYGHD